MNKINFNELLNYLEILELQTINSKIDQEEKQKKLEHLARLMQAVQDCIALNIDDKTSFVAAYMYLSKESIVTWEDMERLNLECQVYMENQRSQQDEVKVYKMGKK